MQANWPELLGWRPRPSTRFIRTFFAKYPCRYHWSVADSEWASDVMFRSRAALEEVYPRLVRYAVTTFDAVDVLHSWANRSLPVVKSRTVAATR